jgi:transposase
VTASLHSYAGLHARRTRPNPEIGPKPLASRLGHHWLSVGAKLFFLPKYSPDLNPIEQVFAKLKHLLRKAAARTVEAVWAAIGQALKAFIPKECANYFQNAGYAST